MPMPEHTTEMHNKIDLSGVKLRDKQKDRFVPHSNRVSKVSSMIELFSGSENDQNKTFVRHSVIDPRPVEEVIKGSENYTSKREPFSQKTRTGISLAVRAPKPFVPDKPANIINSEKRVEKVQAAREGNNKSGNMISSNQNSTAKPSQMEDSKSFSNGKAQVSRFRSENESKSNERKKISKTLNYWEHKIEPKRTPSTTSPKNTLETKQNLERTPSPRNTPEIPRRIPLNERAKNFGPVNNKSRPKSEVFRATVSERNMSKIEEKPAVPSRPRVMTHGSPFMSKPKPFVLNEAPKISSSLHGTNSGIKNRVTNFEKFTKNKSPATSPKLDKQKMPRPKSDLPNRPVVNPLPKPQRTFTFNAADSNPSISQHKPLNRNLIRVSSDASTVKGPSFHENVSRAFFNDAASNSSMSSSSKTSTASSGYEEVVFCDVPAPDARGMNGDVRSKKWRRQHNYEEVDDSLILNSRNPPTTDNYDHIVLDTKQRPHSLSELEDGYSHLKFQQDLNRARQNHPSLLANPPGALPPQHPQLSAQASDAGDIMTRSDSNLDAGKLQITDKIREAFSTIGRRYKHHKKPQEVTDDEANSTSGEEDSDNEADLSKFEQTLERVRTLQKTYRRTLKYKSLERELAGADHIKTTLFEQVLVCKIVADQNGNDTSKVVYRFPAPPPGKPVGDEKTLAHFCFPDISELEPCTEMPSQSYSFMLTRENGTRKFGYCRRVLPPGSEPRYPVVYCLISPLGSFGLYQTILDELERRHRVSIKNVAIFLDSLYVERFPAPGRSIRVTIEDVDGKSSIVVLRRPYDTRLEHVDLQCLLYELGIENTIKIFASLLLERRVILCGRSLGILTACVHALRSLLYPFVWQHVFVPVLPPPMIDLACTPTPLLIGILETSVEKLKTLPLEEVLIVNLPTGKVLSSAGDELEIIPRKFQTALFDALATHTNSKRDTGAQPNYDHAIDYESAERNTIISESFMHLFVEMIGHYQNHFQPVVHASNVQNRHGRILRSFNRSSFYDDVTSHSLRRFLSMFMETTMFDGFIHSREIANANYEGLFEQRISRHLLTADASHLNFKVFKTKMKKLVHSAINAAGGSGGRSDSPKRRNKLGNKI